MPPLLLTSCLPLTRPALQIGLVAPFEGRYRDAGYEVIYAVRLAVREVNRAGGLAGRSVELVALDDSGDPAQAVEQARKLAADPQVLAVLGHWLDETTLAAAPVYARAGLPLLATGASSRPDGPLAGVFWLWPDEAALREALPAGPVLPCFYPCGDLEALDWLAGAGGDRSPRVVGPPRWALPRFPALAPTGLAVDFVAPAPLPADSLGPDFAARYRAISSGVTPGAFAVLAYDGTRLLLEAIARAAAGGAPARAGVAAALPAVNFTGLSGHVSFGETGEWAQARGWLYRWQGDQVVRP